MKKQNKKGFTLVELVIVIAVIAILAGVMIGTFAGVINNAKRSSDMQEVKTKVDEKYYNYIAESNGEVPNCFEWTVEGSTTAYDFDVMEDIEASKCTDAAIKEKLNALEKSGTAYIKFTITPATEESTEETVTLAAATTEVPTDAGNYLIVKFTKSDSSVTIDNKYVMAVKVESSKATYHSTYLEVVGRKKTTVTLSFDGTNYVVANAKD